MTVDFASYVPGMIADRRLLHTYPEEAWTECFTSVHIINRLRAMGIEPLFSTDILVPEAAMGRDAALVRRHLEEVANLPGIDLATLKALGEFTGVLAEIDTGRPGPVTAFRCDIDCIPSQETDRPEHVPNKLGFRSRRDGLQHSCGHDGHTAVGIALCKWILDNRDALCGRFKVLFQPAEEGVRGAASIVAKGVMDDVDYLLASHVGCECKLHEVGVMTEGFLATTKFDVEYFGVASDVSGHPQDGKSALICAAQAAVALQGINRHSMGQTRIAVGTMRAGTGRNVVPDYAKMQCEVRGETTELNAWMLSEAMRIVRGMAEVFGIRVKVSKAGEGITARCDPEVGEVLMRAAQGVKGVEKIGYVRAVRAGSEDCSFLMKAVQEHGGKCGFFFYGCSANEIHHCPDFDIEDEEVLPVALEIAAKAIFELNGAK